MLLLRPVTTSTTSAFRDDLYRQTESAATRALDTLIGDIMTTPMDPSYHALQGQFSGKRPLQWSAVNKPATLPSKPHDSVLNAVVAIPPTPSGLPFPSPLSSDFAVPVPIISQATSPSQLPRPAQILKSQAPARRCAVCCRPGCTLSSHKSFAIELKERRKDRQTVLPGYQTPAGTKRERVQFPVTMDIESQHLLALWSQDWGRVRRGPERHLFPYRWIDAVLPSATGHGPLFQTLLATSATFWAMANNPLDDTAPRHLHLAVQMLAQTCNDEASASTDECVLASILFTLIYLAQGDRYEAERQFGVLVQIVRLRGGPHYLGMSGMLADLLLHADYVQAIFFDREPSFKLLLPALEVGLPPRLGLEFRKLLTSSKFDSDVLLAADSLCRATDIFEHPLTGGPRPPSVTHSFSYLSSISEYQLAHCNSVHHGAGTWNECVILALLLFNTVVLRNHGAIDAPIQILEHRFWIAIETTVTQGGFRDVPPCLLLWVLITGLTPCIYAECKYRVNAVEKMRAARMSAAIHGWEQFRSQVLDSFLWMPSAQEEVFRDVWQEVEGFRAVIRSSTIH